MSGGRLLLNSVTSAAPRGSPFDFTGEHYQVDGAGIEFGGASAAEDVAAQHVDTCSAWGETPAQIRERLDRVRTPAASHGRTRGRMPNGCSRR